MALQRGAALVALDRLFELVVAALEPLHQLLQLGQSLFKAQSSDVGRNGVSGRLVLGHANSFIDCPRVPRRGMASLMSRAAFYRRPQPAARPAGMGQAID